MQRCLFHLAIFSAAATSLPAHAQNIKPGLWEIHNRITSPDSALARQMAQMQQQIAAMPPAQRKAMEQMMAKNAGVNLPTMTHDGMRVKMCMSKEMVEKNQLPVQQLGNCKHQRLPLIGNSMKMSFVCSAPPSSGDGTVHFTSDSAYTMTMQIRSVASGKTELTSMEAKGKWLGANCGDIKPLTLPPG